MPIFIRLVNLTEQGARNMSNLPKMLQDAQRVMEKHDTRVLHQYTTLGNYDLVTIIEAPDARTATRVSAEIAAQGNFRAETLAAVSINEFLGEAVAEEYVAV